MVLISSKKSLENKEISLLALFEIVISIAIYWYIAIKFGIYLHIIIGIVLSPFLLLRSKKSINLGLSLLENGVRGKRIYTPVYRTLFELIILLNTSIITYFILNKFIDNSNYIYIFAVIIFCSGIGLGMGLGLFGNQDNKRIGILSILAVISISIYTYGLNLFLVLSAITILTLILLPLKKYLKFIIGTPLGFLLGLGVAFGFILIILIYKFVAIVSNIRDGYNNIIDNWKYNNFSLDINYKPELMFGLESFNGLDEFKLSNFSSDIKKYFYNKRDIIIPIISFAPYIICYTFALFYRYSIKATFWFYIPLLALVKTPNDLTNIIEVKDFLSKLHRYSYVKLFLFISIITIIIFFLSNLNLNILNNIKNPFAFYISLIYLDFSSIELWKFLQILLALLTVILYFWSDFIWKKYENRNFNLSKNKILNYIFFTNNIRNFISVLYFTFLFLYLSYTFEIWKYKYVPDIIKEFLINIIEIVKYKIL